MGITNYSGPPTGSEDSCGGTCCEPCGCYYMGSDTVTNGVIGNTGALVGAVLGQGALTSAGPGQMIGQASTSTTHIKLKSSPGVFSQNSTETECIRIPLKNGG